MESVLAIASSVTCRIVSGCQNCENQDVEEEGSDGEAHEEDVIYITTMSDCCEKVLRSSGALQPLFIIHIYIYIYMITILCVICINVNFKLVLLQLLSKTGKIQCA